ncbi:hypothetical protein NEIRO03_1812 [Nematocida sp. AWRm78]|nr:hypothetical protein NEIRO02_1835 [Nematocida sp. AWRm79]KAI5184684.1 hypothetical protein NEIRO03_1812 [Nematocida sp. AWRm78]
MCIDKRISHILALTVVLITLITKSKCTEGISINTDTLSSNDTVSSSLYRTPFSINNSRLIRPPENALDWELAVHAMLEEVLSENYVCLEHSSPVCEIVHTIFSVIRRLGVNYIKELIIYSGVCSSSETRVRYTYYKILDKCSKWQPSLIKAVCMYMEDIFPMHLLADHNQVLQKVRSVHFPVLAEKHNIRKLFRPMNRIVLRYIKPLILTYNKQNIENKLQRCMYIVLSMLIKNSIIYNDLLTIDNEEFNRIEDFKKCKLTDSFIFLVKHFRIFVITIQKILDKRSNVSDMAPVCIFIKDNEMLLNSFTELCDPKNYETIILNFDQLLYFETQQQMIFLTHNIYLKAMDVFYELCHSKKVQLKCIRDIIGKPGDVFIKPMCRNLTTYLYLNGNIPGSSKRIEFKETSEFEEDGTHHRLLGKMSDRKKLFYAIHFVNTCTMQYECKWLPTVLELVGNKNSHVKPHTLAEIKIYLMKLMETSDMPGVIMVYKKKKTAHTIYWERITDKEMEVDTIESLCKYNVIFYFVWKCANIYERIYSFGIFRPDEESLNNMPIPVILTEITKAQIIGYNSKNSPNIISFHELSITPVLVPDTYTANKKLTSEEAYAFNNHHDYFMINSNSYSYKHIDNAFKRVQEKNGVLICQERIMDTKICRPINIPLKISIKVLEAKNDKEFLTTIFKNPGALFKAQHACACKFFDFLDPKDYEIGIFLTNDAPWDLTLINIPTNNCHYIPSEYVIQEIKSNTIDLQNNRAFNFWNAQIRCINEKLIIPQESLICHLYRNLYMLALT